MEEKTFTAPPQTTYQNHPFPPENHPVLPENQPLHPAPPTYKQSLNGESTPQFFYQPQSTTVAVQIPNPQFYQNQAAPVVTSTLPASNAPAAAADNQSSNWKICAKFCNLLFAVFMLTVIGYLGYEYIT